MVENLRGSEAAFLVSAEHILSLPRVNLKTRSSGGIELEVLVP